MPLDHDSTTSTGRPPCGIDLAALGRQATLVSWATTAPDEPRRGYRAALDGEPIAPPAAHCVVSHGDRQIHLLALPVAAATLAGARLDVAGLDGATLAAAGGARGGVAPSEFDLVGLVADLRPSERIRLCRFVLEICPPLFKLGREGQFVELAEDVVRALSPRPGRLRAHSLAGPLALYEGEVRRGLGRQLTAVVVSPRGVMRSLVAPRELAGAAGDDDVARVAIALDRESAIEGGIVVVLGETGIACRALPAALPARTSFERARAGKAVDPALRDYLIDALAAVDNPETPSAALLDELRGATAPTTPIAVAGPVGGRLDCLASNAGGIVAIGSLEDPHRLADALIVTRRDRPTVVALADTLHFPIATTAAGRAGDGFVLALPPARDAHLPASVELRIRLRSGETVPIGSGPTAPTLAAEAEAVLRAAAATGCAVDALAQRIGPIVRASLAAAQADEPVLLDVGGSMASPRCSLVTPADVDAALLRARFAAFALDGTLSETELLFTVEDPARLDAVHDLLTGLAGLYGRPARLLATAAPSRDAIVATRAVAAARSPFLVLLDGRAIPRENGWLDALAGALAARPRAGLVAAQMLHADGSLVDAGLCWRDARPPLGGPAPRLAGFPAAFSGHEAAQHADAVRRGAWFMRRSLFELVGGLDAGALTVLGADLAFADRLAVAGFEIWTLGEPRFTAMPSPPADGVRRLREAIDILPLVAAHRARAVAAPPAMAAAAGTAPIGVHAVAAAEIREDAAAVDAGEQPAKPRKRRARKAKRAA